MKKVAIWAIIVYQKLFSKQGIIAQSLGLNLTTCRFEPTCSEYARQSIESFGLIRGTQMSLKRIAKCHPWGGHGIDPVPKVS